MSALDTLINWLAPFLDPMNGFPNYADEINTIHNGSLQKFREQQYKLDPNQALQQNVIISGSFANNIQMTGDDFTKTAADLSEFINEANKLAEVSEDFAEAVGKIMAALEEAGAQLEGEEALTEITADVDIAAVAEGGFNPIADVLGLILTIVDGALLINTLKNLAQEIQTDIKHLQQDLAVLANSAVPDPGPAPQPIQDPRTPGWMNKPVDQAQLQELNTLGWDTKLAGGPYTGQDVQAILENLLRMGLSASDINTIITQMQAVGCNNEQIVAFLKGLLSSDGAYPNSPTPQSITKWFNDHKGKSLYNIVAQYAAIAGIQGAGRLLERIIATNNTGYYYELKWIYEHRDMVARIEDIAPNRLGNPSQAGDVIMKSKQYALGAVVDTKSLAWMVYDKETEKYRPMTEQEMLSFISDKLVPQVKRDESLYRGYPIVYVFDSSKWNSYPADAALRKQIQQELIKQLTTAGATVMTSPPDQVLGVGQTPQPTTSAGPNETLPQMLENGVDGLRKVLTGGSGTPQLPPGQIPPLELPPAS